MAFTDFTFPKVRHDFGLTLVEADLFAGVPPFSPTADFVARMDHGVALGMAVDTEKARSEFIIAPILLELQRLTPGGFGLFSGIEFNVDPARKLNGFCDFILTRSTLQLELTAPVLAIAEAKNDKVHNGLGQCVAAMVAAREFNEGSLHAGRPVYGASTTGPQWKFLRLSGSELTVSLRDHHVTDLPRLLGVLAHIVGGG